MGLYVYENVALQTVLAAVDVSFFLLFGAMVLCFSNISNQATQTAYLNCSILSALETLVGELQRWWIRLRSTYAEPVSNFGHSNNSPTESALLELNPTKSQHHAEVDSVISVKRNRHVSHKSIGLFTFLVFWLVLSTTNYVSSLVNIALGKTAQPESVFLKKQLSSSSKNYVQDYFNLNSDNSTVFAPLPFYDIHGDYSESDQWTKNNIVNNFNDTKNKYNQNLLGTTFFQLDNLICSLFDASAGYTLSAGPFAVSLVKARAFSPMLSCNIVLQSGVIGSFFTIMPVLYNETSGVKSYGILSGANDNVFVGDNLTVISVDRNASLATSMTMDITSYQVSTILFDTVNGSVISDQFMDWFFDNVNNTFAYDLYSTQNPVQFESAVFQDDYTLMSSIGLALKQMNISIYNGQSFASVFTLSNEVSIGVNQYLRFSIVFDTTAVNNQHSAAMSIFGYSTSATVYPINPLNQQNTFPVTVLENATDTFFYPVLFTQPLVNIKPMPIIAGGLAEFFNYTIAGDAAGVSYFTPVGLKYSVMASVAVIVIVTFIAIVLFGACWIVKGGRFAYIPQYYDVLHEYYQNGENCTASIFQISRPLYTGKTYNSVTGKNHIGVTDRRFINERSRKGVSFD